MVEIEIAGENLVVCIKGADRLWALKSEPRSRSPTSPGWPPPAPTPTARLRDWKTSGTQIPGVISAGRFHVDGEHVFRTSRPAKAIEIGSTTSTTRSSSSRLPTRRRRSRRSRGRCRADGRQPSARSTFTACTVR